METAETYEKACRQRGTKPLPDLLAALSSEATQFDLQPGPLVLAKQSEADLAGLGVVLQDRRCRFRELRVAGVGLGRSHLAALCAGLRDNGTLQILDLSNNRLVTGEGLGSLWQCLDSLPGLESLDLSHNAYFLGRLTSEGSTGLCDLIEESVCLRTLILDYNAITGTGLPLALTHNDSLSSLSIESNPLAFDAVMGLLDSLVTNKSLHYLGLGGCRLEGAAPIKENSNGLLSKLEVVTLKLAQVLRHSGLTALALDLDPQADVQLEELESTLVKHNRSLTAIHSKGIDWTKVRGALAGINRALKANQWLAQNERLPKEQRSEPSKDIEDLISTKSRKRTDPATSSPSSTDTYPKSLRNPRSPSPTVLRSQDSAPAAASPENIAHLRLHDSLSADPRGYGSSAGTPQFTPYASTFIKKPLIRESWTRSSAGKTKELATEPSLPTPYSSDRSLSPPRYRSREPPYIESMRSDNEAMRKYISELSSRLALVEEMGLKHREEVLETQDNLEETQKLLRVIEGKFEATETQGKGGAWERLEALEKREVGKVRLFEALGKEVETLRTAQLDSTRQITTLEGQLKAEIAKNELLSKLHSEKAENASKSIQTLLSKQDQLETKMEKLRRELHDSLRTRCKKEVSEAFKRVDSRLQSLESSFPKDLERGSDLTSARADAPIQLARLEERLCDVEREMGNFSTVKKKLLDTTKRVKGLEQGLGASKEAPAPIQTEGFHRVEKVQAVSTSHRARHRPLTPSLKENSSEVWGTERGLGDFLPGEAESVVIGALMERTRRSKRSQADLRLSFRSNSPATSAVRAREPSVDLQEFLKQKGFSFSEAQ